MTSQNIFQTVLAASWQTSLVILLILLVRPVMGARIPARWRSLLWALVLIRLLVPVALLPRNPVSIQNLAVVNRPMDQVQKFLPAASPAAPAAHNSKINLQGPVASGAPSIPATVVMAPRVNSNSWWFIATLVWLAGAIVSLGVLVSARIALWRKLAKTRTQVDPEVTAIWERCWQRLGVKHPPTLCVSPEIASPALVGLFRPMLLLPKAELDGFSAQDWENVFVHELAHYRRRDHWMHMLQLLALALHWFNPAVWLGFRQLRADRELAADEWALQHLDAERSAAYGDTLLKVLAQSSSRRMPFASVGILEDRDQLKQRLQRIAGFSPRTFIGSLAGLCLVAGMAALALGRETEKTDLAQYGSLKPNEILVIAARGGDLPTVKEMLAKGVDPNVSANIEANPQTPLIAAASTGQIPMIEFLVSKGADINLKTDHQADGIPDVQMGPIEHAYKNGMGKCAEFLLKHGAKADPSLIAAAKGDKTVLDPLLSGTTADVKQLKLLCKVAAANGQAQAYRDIRAKIDTMPGESNWNLDDASITISIARGNRDVVQAIIDSGETLNKNGVMRITGPAAQTPGMREWLISKGFTVPVYNDGEKLIDATEREDIPEMARLIKAGADVNYRGDTSWTPITKSAAWDRPHAMRFLLDHGADPNSVHIEGSYYSPLCLTSKPEMADMLLAAGADVNGPNYKTKGEHIISYAAALDRADMVKWYLDHGVDLTKLKPSEDGRTLLFEASNAEIAELLIQHGLDPKAKDKSGSTALHSVCWNGGKAAETARVLLKHGADPNAADKYGMTPLMQAHDGATVDVLVEYGADLTAKTKQGTGLLEIGGGSGDATRIEALLRHGVPFDPKTQGPTILMLAAWSGQTDAMSLLLDRGVDPNAKGLWNKEANMYQTPLQAAVTSGQYAAAKLLIEHGAKIQEHSLSTAKAKHFNEMLSALDNRRTAIVKLFWEHGDRSVSELVYAVSQGAPLADIKKMLDGGMPADPPQDEELTPLALAAELGRMDVVKLLVEHGAKVEGRELFSPVAMAADEGQDEILSYLLQHGGKADYLPLQNAIWNSHPYDDQRSADHFEKCVKILIDAGATKDLPEKQSAELLVRAIFTRYPGGNQKVIQMLLDAGLSLNASYEPEGKPIIELARSACKESTCSTPSKEMMDFLEKAAAKK